MKLSKIPLTITAAALIAGFAARADDAPTPPAPPPVAPDEDQPHMQAALAALQTAQAELEKATHDKGGHRKAALELVKKAVEQVNKGIAFDDKHDNDKGKGKKKDK